MITPSRFGANQSFALILATVISAGASSAQTVQEDWVRRYNGPAGAQNDGVVGVAYDQNGDIVVAGFSLAGSAVYSSDYFVIKYDNAGTELWNYRFRTAGPSVPNELVVDGDGSIYVTGWSDSDYTNNNYFTLKLSASGALLWSAEYDPPDEFDDEPRGMTVDASGQVYVTGEGGRNSVTSSRATTIKYGSNGAVLWTASYIGPGIGDDVGTDVAVDSATGDVYVSMNSDGGPDFDFVLVKYNANGALQWERRYDTPFTQGHDFAEAVEVDDHGDIVVAGRSVATLGPGYDLVVAKYAANGDLIWLDRYDGPGGGTDFLADLELDSAGDIYLASTSEDSSFIPGMVVVKYAADGTRLWDAEFRVGESGDGAVDLTVDLSGAAFVAGWTRNNSFDYDGVLVRFNPDGSFGWSAVYDGPVSGDDDYTSVAADGQGRVVAGGSSDGGATRFDFVTVQYLDGEPFDLLLEQDPLRRNRAATFIVTGGRPGETVYFLYSFAGVGEGPCPPALGGLCLDLLNPITNFGSAPVDSLGVASLTLTVPPNAPLREVSTQAVIRRGANGAESEKSNTVTASILP